MINFTRAFTLAWERMVIILFQPFNLGKWCVIGFSAFLAGLLSGGNGFSGGSYPGNKLDRNQLNPGWSTNYSFPLHQQMLGWNGMFSGWQPGYVIFFFIATGIFLLACIVLLYWLGARGQFLLLDNVVRNRGAIEWPWRAYEHEGNSVFLFYLLFLLCSLVILVPPTLLGVYLGMPFFRQNRWPAGGDLVGLTFFSVFYFVLLIAVGILLFLFRELGVPLMFRNRMRAWPALREVGHLVSRAPGTILLFVLLRLALFVALVIVSLIVCCVSCCLEILPYIGTVLLLPALVYIKCFTLDFLAQFGPAYDVWTVDVPGSPSGGLNASGDPASPPPPPG